MVGLILVVLALSVLFYLRGQAIAGLRERARKAQAAQEKLIEENEQLKELFARKNDLEYIEYLARRELGLIRLREEKYILLEREP
jgi:cell division protein FtsB